MTTDANEPTDGDEPTIDFDAVATHVECPQKRAYRHDMDVQPARTDRSFERRRRLLRSAILAALDGGTESLDGGTEPGDDVGARAKAFVDRHWDGFTDEGLYLADRQERFDRAVARRSLEAYFSGEHCPPLDAVVAAGTTVGIDTDAGALRTPLDLCCRTGPGELTIYRYRPSLLGVSNGYPGTNMAREHLTRDDYHGRYLPSVLRADLSIRGVRAAYGDDLPADGDVRYVVVGLHDTVSTGTSETRPTAVEVEAATRDLTAWHREHGDANRELLRQAAAATEAADTTIPEAWVDELRGSTCRYCEFKDMCTQRFNWEVEY